MFGKFFCNSNWNVERPLYVPFHLSGIYGLEDIIKNAQSKNIKVFVSSAKTHIKEVLEKIDFIKHIGKDNYKDSKESVILNY